MIPTLTDPHCARAPGTPPPPAASCILHVLLRPPAPGPASLRPRASGAHPSAPCLPLAYGALGLCSLFVSSWAGSWAVGKETLVLCCSASRGERVRDFPLSWAAGPACQDDGGPGSACWGGGERRGGWRGGGGGGGEPEHMNQQISLGAFNLPLEDRGVPLPVL